MQWNVPNSQYAKLTLREISSARDPCSPLSSFKYPVTKYFKLFVCINFRRESETTKSTVSQRDSINSLAICIIRGVKVGNEKRKYLLGNTHERLLHFTRNDMYRHCSRIHRICGFWLLADCVRGFHFPSRIHFIIIIRENRQQNS